MIYSMYNAQGTVIIMCGFSFNVAFKNECSQRDVNGAALVGLEMKRILFISNTKH